MGSHTLTNLLSTANMTISGATLSDNVFTFPATVFCMINQSLPVPIAGHLYYGRVDQKVSSGTTFSDSRFEYFGGDGEGKHIVFTQFSSAIQDDQWHTYSNIVSFPYISGSNWTLRSFCVSGSQTAYRRNHMIIDLTEAFGAGHEPTKEWCDTNIDFFEDSITIITGYVGVNDVAKKINNIYVGVNGVAKRITVGYVGVNGVARIIYGTSNIVRYKKYTITHEWGIEECDGTLMDIFTYNNGGYLNNNPPFNMFSDTKPQFDFSNQATTVSFEQGINQRRWNCVKTDNGYYDIGITTPTSSDYFVILSSATKTLYNTMWKFTGTIYNIVLKGDAKGTYIETIMAPKGTYPDNGIKDGYWWVREDYKHFDTDKALNKGSLIDLSGWSTIEYLNVPAGCTNITIETGMASGDHDCLCEYDANKNYLSYWGGGANPRTFTFDYPEQTKFIRATFLTSAIDNCYIYDNTNGQYILKGKNVAL